MKYAIEMGSGAMIYIPSFVNIGSGIQKLMGPIHRQQGNLINRLRARGLVLICGVACVKRNAETLKLNVSVRNVSRRRRVIIM
jgi:hypothetical protein